MCGCPGAPMTHARRRATARESAANENDSIERATTLVNIEIEFMAVIQLIVDPDVIDCIMTVDEESLLYVA